MVFPSGEYAHAVILVRVPRSLDLTEMTTFCFRRFSTSQILQRAENIEVRRRGEHNKDIVAERKKMTRNRERRDEPDRAVVRRGHELGVVLGVPATRCELSDVSADQSKDKTGKGRNQRKSRRRNAKRDEEGSRSVFHVSDVGISLHVLGSSSVPEQDNEARGGQLGCSRRGERTRRDSPRLSVAVVDLSLRCSRDDKQFFSVRRVLEVMDLKVRERQTCNEAREKETRGRT